MCEKIHSISAYISTFEQIDVEFVLYEFENFCFAVAGFFENHSFWSGNEKLCLDAEFFNVVVFVIDHVLINGIE